MTVARNIQDDSAQRARYRVVTTLGSGGTAMVYLAVAERSAGFQKLVVLKTLLGHLANDPSVTEMFRNEARISARLKHPNVVEVYEVLDDGNQPVLVMEYLRGACLRDIVKKSADPIPLRHHLDIVRQSCRGLHHCHELKDFDGTPMHFIHRDVSPHNIYVTFEGEVRLLDFGIAKVQGNDGGTQTGLLKGKIRYMAPEQMMGEPLDRRADIYAIGVVLWEALSGREMWDGLTEGMILHRTVNGDLPDIEPTVEGVTPEMIEIVQRCLAVNRDDRYETTEEIADALDQVLRSLPDPRRRLGQMVSSLFAGRDDEVNELVRETLSNTDASPSYAGGPIDWGDALLEVRTGSHLFDSRSMFSRATRSTPVPPAPASNRKGTRMLLVGAVVLAAVGGGLALYPKPPPPIPLAPLPAAPLSLPTQIQVATNTTLQALGPAPGTVKAAAPTPDRVKIRVVASPADAELFLDDEPITNPSTLSRLADGNEHVLRASARGYTDAEQIILFDEDQELELKLSRRYSPRRTSTDRSPKKALEADAPADAPPTPPAAEEPKPKKKSGVIGLEDECKSEYVLREDGLLGMQKPKSSACRK